MKRQIRLGVFETNSSSTHSLTMCSKEEYDKWESGELVLNENWEIKGKQFIKLEEAIEYLKENGEYDEDDLDTLLRENEFYTESQYFDNDYLEGFSSTYTTKSGEKIVAFGVYGMDG